MNNDIFKKLKVKPKMSALILHPPDNYPDYDEFDNTDDNKKDFVHLFVRSNEEFNERFENASNNIKKMVYFGYLILNLLLNKNMILIEIVYGI